MILVDGWAFFYSATWWWNKTTVRSRFISSLDFGNRCERSKRLRMPIHKYLGRGELYPRLVFYLLRLPRTPIEAQWLFWNLCAVARPLLYTRDITRYFCHVLRWEPSGVGVVRPCHLVHHRSSKAREVINWVLMSGFFFFLIHGIERVKLSPVS